MYKRQRLDRREGGFSLGRLELPVTLAALVWVLLVLVVLVTPPTALIPVIIVFGLLCVGGLYFARLMTTRREILYREPDAGDDQVAIEDPSI